MLACTHYLLTTLDQCFQLTSQLPYLEDTGAPHVLTFNIQDTEEVKKAVNDALKAVETGKVGFIFPL